MNKTTFVFPTLGTRTDGRSVLLAIDDHSLPLRNNLCYYLSKPAVRSEPVLTPSFENSDAPDHSHAHFYGTVLQEGGKFRMWYYGQGRAENEGELTEGPICYAESEDGLRWVKPNLGQFEFRERLDHNAIALPDPGTEGVQIIVDPDDPDPRRRYKMTYEACPAFRCRNRCGRLPPGRGVTRRPVPLPLSSRRDSDL